MFDNNKKGYVNDVEIMCYIFGSFAYAYIGFLLERQRNV